PESIYIYTGTRTKRFRMQGFHLYQNGPWHEKITSKFRHLRRLTTGEISSTICVANLYSVDRPSTREFGSLSGTKYMKTIRLSYMIFLEAIFIPYNSPF